VIAANFNSLGIRMFLPANFDVDKIDDGWSPNWVPEGETWYGSHPGRPPPAATKEFLQGLWRKTRKEFTTNEANYSTSGNGEPDWRTYGGAAWDLLKTLEKGGDARVTSSVSAAVPDGIGMEQGKLLGGSKTKPKSQKGGGGKANGAEVAPAFPPAYEKYYSEQAQASEITKIRSAVEAAIILEDATLLARAKDKLREILEALLNS
jgi:hypothetical protein